jgi:hypothetical protein
LLSDVQGRAAQMRAMREVWLGWVATASVERRVREAKSAGDALWTGRGSLPISFRVLKKLPGLLAEWRSVVTRKVEERELQRTGEERRLELWLERWERRVQRRRSQRAARRSAQQTWLEAWDEAADLGRKQRLLQREQMRTALARLVEGSDAGRLDALVEAEVCRPCCARLPARQLARRVR